MDRGSATPGTFGFGRFVVAPDRRELLLEGRPVKLGGRAFDLLMALIEAPGVVVDKDALMERVWPGRIVEDNSLQVQISALRVAFGPDRELIRTVPGRGYQFTGDVRHLAEAPGEDSGSPTTQARSGPLTNLPQAVSELIGRDDDLRELLDTVGAHRLVTVTGAGGIGKTRLALTAARAQLPEFADGVWVAELGSLTHGGLVPGAVARATGLELSGGGASADRVADALAGRALLLVIDNCEHVVAEAALMAEALLRASPALRVIATSREPLKAEGEWVYPAPPLAAPEADAVGDPLEYGAVRLFVERVRAAQPHFAPDRRLADVIAATRTYAREKLHESGETGVVARLHAEHHRELFERAEAEWDKQPTAEWLAEYGRKIDDLRAALDWAFSPAGDEPLGVALTAAAAPLWMHLSLPEELRRRAEHALRALQAGAQGNAQAEMKLLAALAGSMMLTSDPPPELGEIWAKALAIAERLGDVEYQLRSLWGVWAFHSTASKHHAAVELAHRFLALAAKRSNRSEELVGEQMIGVSTYFKGDLIGAQPHFDRVLADRSSHRSQIIRYQLDPRVTSGSLLARILWLRGFPEQALRTAESAIEEAEAIGDVNSACMARCSGASIALWVGDLDRAEWHVARLIDHATRYALGRWRAVGRCQEAVLIMKRGEVARGVRQFRRLMDELGDGFFVMNLVFHGDAAEGFLQAAQTPEGLAAAQETIARCEQTEEGWMLAELLRIRGELVALQVGPRDPAESLFRQALDVARRQGALSWELRAATSLALLMRDQGRYDEAGSLLAPIYETFTEGFHSADLTTAKTLIDSLRPA